MNNIFKNKMRTSRLCLRSTWLIPCAEYYSWYSYVVLISR